MEKNRFDLPPHLTMSEDSFNYNVNVIYSSWRNYCHLVTAATTFIEDGQTQGILQPHFLTRETSP